MCACAGEDMPDFARLPQGFKAPRLARPSAETVRAHRESDCLCVWSRPTAACKQRPPSTFAFADEWRHGFGVAGLRLLGARLQKHECKNLRQLEHVLSRGYKLSLF